MDKLNKVCTNFEQDFTETEKAQARRNIGAQQELIQGNNIEIVGNTISAIVPTPEPQPIPPINDAQLTIQKNGTTVGTFTANASVPSVVNIAVPTKTSDITNDSGFITSSDLPTVGNGQITIQKNGDTVDSFKVNQSSAKTINITVPTKTSDITNDSGFITSSDLPTVNDARLTIQRNGTTLDTFTANASVDKTINISVPPDNLFIAEYNVSTWAQVKAAYDAGKAIILVGADFGSNIHTQMALYDFNTTAEQTRKFLFAPTVTPRVAAYYRYYAVLDETDGWSKNYLSGTAPTKCGGIFQLTGDETTYNLVEHRGWLCNEIYNFDVRFFSSPNACNIYIGYVTGNQSLKVDVVGTRRNVRNDLKSQIDQTTTVQTYVRDIDAWSRIVKVDQPLTSADLRIDLATLGPQEQSNYNYDIYWDLDLIFHQWGVTGSASPCYHLHLEKYGDPGEGHSYLFGTLAGTDLY